MSNTNAERWMIGWAVALGLTLVPSVAPAAELTKFTGYTRPGIPTAPPGAFKLGGDRAADGALGATVYFKVFELGGEDDGDLWGTGVKNLDRLFVSGQASRGRNVEKLDTTARYLYLYQVVNDSYRDGQVKSAAVRLLVPPHLITSWGHFAEKRDKVERGIGFSMLFHNPDPKNPNAKSMVLPLSTNHAGVTDDVYRDPAPYFHPPRPYGLSNIQLNNKPAPLTDGEDTGREPERVVLQSTYNFEGAPNWLVKDGVGLPLSPLTRLALPSSNLGNPYYNPASPLMPAGMAAMSTNMVPGMPGSMGSAPVNMSESLRRAPAVVAYWTDDPLRPAVVGGQPGQRSTVFGFTSNFPPVYDDVRVRGNPVLPVKAPAAPAADASPANLRVDGEVPTPVAFEQGTPPMGHALGSFGGPIGEIGAGGGFVRGGGGMGGGGFGFGFGGGGLGGGGMGGGTGGGSGSGTGNGNGSGNTLSNSAALNAALLALLQNRSILSQSVAVNVAQSQSQNQQQQQQQQQNQHQHQHGHHHGHVVPEPAAIVSALLGVPFLFLLIWRRKVFSPAAT